MKQTPRIRLAAACVVAGTCAFLAISATAHPGHHENAESASAPAFFLAQAAPQSSAPEAKLKNEVTITVEGDYRVIHSNDIPDHPAGEFPRRGNPNTISPQHYEFRVPLHPKAAPSPTVLRMQPFGVAINGVKFDPGADEWWNNDRSSGWQIELLQITPHFGFDENNAHVQPNGAYHYHAIPTGLLERVTGGKEKVALLGWAADGFPIYGPWGYSDAQNAKSPLKKLKSSYRVKKGMRPSGPGGAYTGYYKQDWEYAAGAGDLDECNGRIGVTPEFPAGTYYYVCTEDWPYIPRMFRGTPDPSFRGGSPPGGGLRRRSGFGAQPRDWPPGGGPPPGDGPLP